MTSSVTKTGNSLGPMPASLNNGQSLCIEEIDQHIAEEGVAYFKQRTRLGSDLDVDGRQHTRRASF